MKLSEAIRRGAMLSPPAKWTLYDASTGGTCAQGAAALAIGHLDIKTGRYLEPFPPEIVAEWEPPLMAIYKTPCPRCGKHEGEHLSNGVIAHLNNEHEWTREVIADWIESIEHACAGQAEAHSEGRS